jgi:hypothetical protein
MPSVVAIDASSPLVRQAVWRPGCSRGRVGAALPRDGRRTGHRDDRRTPKGLARFAGPATLVLALLAGPLAARAERVPRIPRIGVVYSTTPVEEWLADPFTKAFLEGLEELHWVNGRDFVLEYRTAERHFERVQGLVDGLIAQKVDLLLFMTCRPEFHVARQATRTIPIVVGCADDLIGKGIVASRKLSSRMRQSASDICER